MKNTAKGLLLVLVVFSIVFFLQPMDRPLEEDATEQDARGTQVKAMTRLPHTVLEAGLSHQEDKMQDNPRTRPFKMEMTSDKTMVMRKNEEMNGGHDINISAHQPTQPPPKGTGDQAIESTEYKQTIAPQTQQEIKTGNEEEVMKGSKNESMQRNVMKMIEETQPDDDQVVKTDGLKVCSADDRLKNLQAKCDEHPELQANTGYFPHTKVDDKHKVIICVVPKAAGTSIHNMLHLTMTGELAPDPNHCGESCWEDAGVWPLSHFPEKERLRRLKEYHKIIVVRNPFERLISCWNDKFKHPGGSLHNRQHGFRLIDRIRGVPVNFDIAKELPWWTPLDILMKKNYSEEIKRELKKEMTLKEFVMLMDNYERLSPELHDDHWKPIHQICQPCFVKYDYMVRVETLQQDARHILEKLELDMDRFPHFNSNRESTSQLTKELPIYEELPENLKQMLEDYYKTDMDLFGYQWDKVKDKASCQNYTSQDDKSCC